MRRLPEVLTLMQRITSMRAPQYLEWGGALVGMLINLFWLSAPKPLKVTIYIGLGWLVRKPHSYQPSCPSVQIARTLHCPAARPRMSHTILYQNPCVPPAGAAVCAANEGGSGAGGRVACDSWRDRLHRRRGHICEAVPGPLGAQPVPSSCRVISSVASHAPAMTLL